MAKESVLIIGAGNMGGALARGLSRAAGANVQVRVYDKSDERAERLVADTKATKVPSLKEAELKDDVIVICVKPQDLPVVAADVSGRIASKTLVISILAGTPMRDVARLLAFEGAVVRAMPNIAATVLAAATAMCANAACTETHKSLAERIFRAVGEADWTKEALLDAVTGLSGSGPAYLYMVIEALTDGGVKMGLPRQLSASLATQTVLGSAMLVKATGLHPAILRDQVTTPGGTTIAAIHELEERGLRAMLISAVATATERSAMLRKKVDSED